MLRATRRRRREMGRRKVEEGEGTYNDGCVGLWIGHMAVASRS